MIDHISNKTIGQRLKKIRRASGMSQTELAKSLNCDQASISRLEAGIQGINTIQLYTISQVFKLKIDNIISGQINYWAISQDFGRRPKIKKRYLSHVETYGREIIPLLRLLEEERGIPFTKKLLDGLGLGELAFIPPDERVGIRCYLDLIAIIINQGLTNIDYVERWIPQYKEEEVLGSLLYSFSRAAHPLQVSKLIVYNNDLLDSIFTYKIIECSCKHLVISLKKKSYLQGIDLEKSQISSTLLAHKMAIHNLFPQLFCGRSVTNTPLKEFKKNLTGEAKYRLEV